jgi:hypothetical protein
MILYSLLKKRAVWIKEVKPSVILDVMEGFKESSGEDVTPLRYYEIDFIKSLKTDGALDEKRLAETYMNIRRTVESKLKGYCRKDTIDYYKSTAKKAWEQVKMANTGEIASQAYDENLLWLLLDNNYKENTEEAFQDRDFIPLTHWWWYWYGYGHYHPQPTYIPTEVKTRPPPKIPGSDLADNIATSIEKTAGGIVTNLEKFADSILPAPRPSNTSHDPAHHDASCVCACHSCACVCACVSCACACAGGGGVG